MKKLIDFLLPLGLIVMIGSQAWVRAGKSLPGKLQKAGVKHLFDEPRNVV